MCVYTYTHMSPGAFAVYKRKLDILVLELQALVSCLI